MNIPPPPPQRPAGCQAACVAALLLLLSSGQALAGTISCTMPPPFTRVSNITLNLSDYNAAQPGQVLTGDWIAMTSQPATFNCAFSGHGSGIFALYIDDQFQVVQPRVSPPITLSHEGKNHYVYQVPGIPSLGYILRTSAHFDNIINNDSPSEWKRARYFPGGGEVTQDPQTVNNMLWYIARAKLVKLQGGLQGPFPINSNFVLTNDRNQVTLRKAGSGSQNNPAVSSAQLQQFAFRMNLNVIDNTPRSCTSPSVPPVMLPTVWPSNFNGQGSTTGETPFEIKFHDCTDNLASISYKFTPSNNVPSPDPAIGLLGNSGTATGVAVQIVHDNPQRTPHPLNVDAILSDPATGLPVDGDFDFKLRARYYQTDNAAPTGGTVQAVMIVHLVYQ